MMDQFKRQYRPGGMGLAHSSWWISVTVLRDGIYWDLPIQFIERSDYQ